ncbi:MAG: DoxX family protein [Actinomycetota bacterium]|nr:DoxX family protein [Actinomycetota bacterium]
MSSILTGKAPAVADAGQLVLRFAVAAVFIAHGYGDVFEAGVSTNVQNYRDAGIPLAALAAPFAAYTQLFGGILVALGALTRLMAAGFIVVMLGALTFVHRGESLVMGQDGSGSGFAFIMCAASITLLLLGPGRISADQVLADRWARSRRSVETQRA